MTSLITSNNLTTAWQVASWFTLGLAPQGATIWYLLLGGPLTLLAVVVCVDVWLKN